MSASYPIHGQGRVWRLARKEGAAAEADEWPKLGEGERAAAEARARADTGALRTDDRFLWQAAVWGLAKHGVPAATAWGEFDDPRVRLGVLAAARWSEDETAAAKYLPVALGDRDSGVQLAAVRWVADARLKQFRPQLEAIAGAAADGSALAKGARAALEHLRDG